MARITIPCLVARTNKRGITSWYWQPSKTLRDAGWEPQPLGSNEGAAIAAARARNEEIEAWRKGASMPQAVRRHAAQGTVAALIARYRREYLYGKRPSGAPILKPKTIESYATALDRIDAWAGKHPIAYVTPARVRALRDAIAKPKDKGGLGQSAAFNLLAVLRQLFRFAESVDLIPKGSNPATHFGLEKAPPRSSVWELEDDAAFDAAAYELGLPSMVLAREIALFSAQREGDLIAFTEPQFQQLDIFDPRLREILAGEDGTVMGWSLVQQKGSNERVRREMQIPFEPKLALRVADAIRTNRARDRAADPPRLVTSVLVDDRTGLPWKKRAFIQCYRKVLDHAADRTGRTSMRTLTWHDIRRTRVVRLRRRGTPKEMIAAITGHDPKTIDEMLKVYGPIDPTTTAAAIAGTLEERRA